MKLSVQLTVEDYIHARRLSMRPRRWLRIVGYVVLALFTVFIVWVGYEGFVLGKPQKDFWMIIGLVAYLLVIYYVLIPWRTKRIFRQQKTLHQPIELEFTDTHFFGSSPHGTFKMGWSDFHKWKKDDHSILVYQSAALMHMIPIRAFQSSADIELLVATLRKHLGPEKA